MRPGNRRKWKLLALLITLGSVLWVIQLLLQAWPGLVAGMHEIRMSYLLVGLGLSIASAYLTFAAFATLVAGVGFAGITKRQLAHLYFTGQLLKHLPGRVWGVGYQWTAGNSVSSIGGWVMVNLGHMLLATYFALWSAWVALALMSGVAWGLMALLGGLIAYLLCWRLTASRVLHQAITRLPGRIGSLATRALETMAAVPAPARWSIFILFCASWSLFYLAWAAFGLAHSSLDAAEGVRMCAYYMIAWFAGYISFLTPSGLGVRELVFAWLAQDYSVEVIALMAIVGRTSLLAVDIILGLLFAPFAPRRK